MKRLVCAILALTLLLPLALAQGADQTFATDEIELTVPADWTIDTEDLTEDEDFHYMCYLIEPGDPSLVVECALVYYEDFLDVYLDGSDEKTLNAYIGMLLDEKEADSPELVTVVDAGGISIPVLCAQDEEGPYLYADTMLSGQNYVFYAYSASAYEDGTLEMDDDDLETFISILSTFRVPS